MDEVLVVFDDRLAGRGGAALRARVCGRKLADGRWEGWIEFTPGEDDSTSAPVAVEADEAPRVLRTPRETLQPSRRDLAYWATGLTHTYLEGALGRVVDAERPAPRRRGLGPRKPQPARPGRPGRPLARREREVRPGRIGAGAAPLPAQPVLDPFEVWRQGEDLLRRELEALSPMHLRSIVRAFALGERPSDEIVGLDAETLRREILDCVGARLRKDAQAARDSPVNRARPSRGDPA